MFTGIVEQIGKVLHFDNHHLVIEGIFPTEDIRLGDSIAVNGVCQTVTEFSGNTVAFHVLDESRNVTNFQFLRPGDRVNLELAMKHGGRLGGHIVQGHVDCIQPILDISKIGDDTQITVKRPPLDIFPIIHRGSIAINGISLTVARLEKDRFAVRIIPSTWQHTNLQFQHIGSMVNLEADIIGKYVQELLPPYQDSSSITMDMLKNAGF